MAFTYDPAASEPSALTLIRSEIGDVYDTRKPVHRGRGVKPYGDNFTDAEIMLVLTREGAVAPLAERALMRAAARLLEQLSRMWSRMAASQSVGPRSTSYKQADDYAKRAKELRDVYGFGGVSASSSAGADVSVLVRSDGYSDYADGLAESEL